MTGYNYKKKYPIEYQNLISINTEHNLILSIYFNCTGIDNLVNS